ncbi:MAG: transglycosylase SLT domain-containing protein [bacterium]
MHLKILFKVYFALSLLFFIASCSLIKPMVVTKKYTLYDVVSAIESENYSLAYRELKHVDISSVSPESLTKYRFVQAVLSYKLGYYTQAQKYLTQLLLNRTGMEDYIAWYLANSYIKTSNYNSAINVLQTIAHTYTMSVFYKPAILLMGECMTKDRQYNKAIQLYSDHITDPDFFSQLPQLLIQRAALYISDNNIDKGIKDYVRVYTSFPDSSYATIAFHALSSITDVSTLNIDHSSIASLLMMDGKYSAAIPELELAINTCKQTNNSGEGLSSLYLNLGMAYYYTGKYNNAIQVLRQANLYNDKKKHEPEILFWLGKAFTKYGDIENAKKVFLKVAHLNSSYTPMAMYRLSQIYQQTSDQTSTEYWLKRLAGLDTPFSILADWELGWYYYRQANFNNAIYYFNKLEHSKYSDESEKTKAMYWKARTLLKTGEVQHSEKIFFKIINENPFSYYSVMSNLWFDENTLDFSPKDLVLPEPFITPGDFAFNYHYSRYAFLNAVGFKKEAIDELNAASSLNLTKEEAFLLCHAYYKNDHYFDSLYLARTRFSDKLKTLDNETLPVWFYSYPLGYANILKGYKEKYGIDPLILYALILQESKFNPDAISNAGALGIMQIMPATAKRAAKNINLEPFSRELLFDPQINIGIGTWYFNNLMIRYKGNYVLSLAAYNAGEKAVDTWLKNSTDCNTDEFIEDIPFEETRHYIKNILSNLVAYAKIYGGSINLKEHVYLEGSFLKACLASH